jgi:hypothetical protein
MTDIYSCLGIHNVTELIFPARSMRQERLDTGWGPGRESTHSYNAQGPPRCGE